MCTAETRKGVAAFAAFAIVALGICLVLETSTAKASALQHAEPATVGVSLERLAPIDQLIHNAIFKNEIPGAVVLVARKGTVVYRKAFGFRSAEPALEPMTSDSVFDVASLTKVVVTATSIMILVEEGRLALTDAVAEYIPEFGRRGKREITLLQLLTHYSGLQPDLDLTASWEGYEKAIQLACLERPVEQPGKRFIYSDINYFVLGEVVRRVSGLPLDQFANERIFVPLGMKDTAFNPRAGQLPRIVPTSPRDGVMLRGKVHDPTSSRMGGVAGHAGLFSTVDDIATWAQMILNGGIYEEVRVLSPLSVLLMTTSQSPTNEENWRGLGFDIQTRFSTTRGDLFPVGSFGHTGFTGTSLWIDPFSETLVLLFTSRLHPKGKGDVVSLRQRVASVVAASLIDLPLERKRYKSNY